MARLDEARNGQQLPVASGNSYPSRLAASPIFPLGQDKLECLPELAAVVLAQTLTAGVESAARPMESYTKRGTAC